MKLITLLSPYVIALILTLIIEGILCWVFLQSKQWLKFTCLVNLFTNPLVNALYTMLYFSLAKHQMAVVIPPGLLVLEIAVWLFEAWLFYRFDCKQETENPKNAKLLSSIYKALLFSLALNAASYLSGLQLQI